MAGACARRRRRRPSCPMAWRPSARHSLQEEALRLQWIPALRVFLRHSLRFPQPVALWRSAGDRVRRSLDEFAEPVAQAGWKTIRRCREGAPACRVPAKIWLAISGRLLQKRARLLAGPRTDPCATRRLSLKFRKQQGPKVHWSLRRPIHPKRGRDAVRDQETMACRHTETCRIRYPVATAR